ncbi:hypothetical protein QR680_011219 [Steinernema hermaphroditum]|uniref:Uncharacterized protein n=1 Tax=Steinernema hermaphroditum TaxID=289476 RepID=A0AA39ITZ8_9BILA|nr:hypothetical protein QR680_011219 [Steinernema hermaphroditum]
MSFEVEYYDKFGIVPPSCFFKETKGRFVSVTDVVREVFNDHCGAINDTDQWALVYEKRPNCATERLDDPQSFHIRMCNKNSKYTIEFHSNKDRDYETFYFHVPATNAPLVVRQRARSRSRWRVPSDGMEREEDGRPSRARSRSRVTFAEPEETKEVERPAVINVFDLPSLPPTTPEPLPVEPEIRSMPPATPREPVFTTVPEPKAPLIRREKSPSPKPPATVPPNAIAKPTNLEANECRIDIDTNICGSDGRTFTYVENFKIGPQSGPIKRRLVQLHNNKLNQCRKDGYNVLGAAFKMNWTMGTFELVENANSVLFEAGQTYRFKYDESKEEHTPTTGWFPMQPSRPYPFSVTFRLVLPPHFEPWIQTTTLNLCRPYKVSQLIYYSKSYLRAPLSRMGSSVLNVAVYQTAPVRQELGYTDYFSEGSSFDIHFVANGVDYPMPQRAFAIAVDTDGNQHGIQHIHSIPGMLLPTGERGVGSPHASFPAPPPNPQPPAKEEYLVNYTTKPIKMFKAPERKIIVRLPCPNEDCGEQSIPRTWSCFVCNTVLYYGFDDFLYCDCGKLEPKHLTFKCTGHGNFVPYKENVLAKKLRKTSMEKA